MNSWILRVGAVDHRLLQEMALRRRPAVSWFMRGWTGLGDPVAVLVLGALLALLGAFGGHSGSLQAVVTLALSHLFSQALKRGVSRPRPVLPEGLRSLVEAPDRFSFPSGHASATLALALLLRFPLSSHLSHPISTQPFPVLLLPHAYFTPTILGPPPSLPPNHSRGAHPRGNMGGGGMSTQRHA